MKQLLIELDDELAEGIERLAPASSRRRSEFIRNALKKALWEAEERATRAAYEKTPDSPADAHVDPAVWEARPAARKKKPRGAA